MEISTNNSNTSQKPEEEYEPDCDLLGDNENILNEADAPVVPQNNIVENPERDKYKKALDAICKTWSEVKVLQMKASDVKFYLNKNKSLKGDNTVPDPPPQAHQFQILVLADLLEKLPAQCLLK